MDEILDKNELIQYLETLINKVETTIKVKNNDYLNDKISPYNLGKYLGELSALKNIKNKLEEGDFDYGL